MIYPLVLFTKAQPFIPDVLPFIPNDHSIPMKDLDAIDIEGAQALYEMHTQLDSPLLQTEEERQSKILEADYSKVDIDAMVKGLDIPKDLKRKLKSMLLKHDTLFSGGLGEAKVEPVDIKLKPGFKPYQHKGYYSVPKMFEKPGKNECNRLVKAGILKRLDPKTNSPWVAPSFFQPKKDMGIRFLTGLREINKWIERNPFLLPKIVEALKKIEKFVSATAIDLSQGYYHIPMSKEAQKILSTVVPWGRYSYKRLPMGLASAPDIFQNIMTNLFHDLDYVLVYLDDILVIQREGESEEDHLNKIDEVLTRLEKMDFRANLRKSFCMQQEIGYLDYSLTTKGVKPQKKKIEAMKKN